MRRLRAFDEQFGQQQGRAVIGGGFREHTALKDRAKFHEWQAGIFLDQKLQAIAKGDFLDGVIGIGFYFRLTAWAWRPRAAARKPCDSRR